MLRFFIYLLCCLAVGGATVALAQDGEAVATVNYDADAHVDANANVQVHVDPQQAAREALSHATEFLPTRLAVEAYIGVGNDEAEVNHLLGGVAADLEIEATDWLGFGARGAAFVMWDEGADTDGDGADDNPLEPLAAYSVSAGPRFRVFTDHGRREAWRFELGGGYRFVTADMGHDGGFVEAAVARQISGADSESKGAVGGSLVLRYQQGFGAIADYRALTLGAQFQWERGFGPSAVDDSASFPYTLGFDVMAGSTLAEQGAMAPGRFTGGAGVTFGIPIGAWIEPIVRADAIHLAGDSETDDLAVVTGLAGMRVRFNEALPLYLDASGGYAFTFNTPAQDVQSGAVLDFGLGVRSLRPLRR